MNTKKLREMIAKKIYPDIFTRHQKLNDKYQAILKSDKVVVIDPHVVIDGIKENSKFTIVGDSVKLNEGRISRLDMYGDTLHVGGMLTLGMLNVGKSAVKKTNRREKRK